MKIIFLKDLAKKGRRYEMKDVTDGYGRFLVSKGIADFATPENVARIERKRATDATEKKVHTDLLLKNLGDIKDVTITLYGKANESGHLFASIHKEEILKELKNATRLDMHPDYVILDKPLKEVGAFEVPIVIDEFKTTLKVNVEAK